MQNLFNMPLFLKYAFICSKNSFSVLPAKQIVYNFTPLKPHCFKKKILIHTNPDFEYMYMG